MKVINLRYTTCSQTKQNYINNQKSMPAFKNSLCIATKWNGVEQIPIFYNICGKLIKALSGIPIQVETAYGDSTLSYTVRYTPEASVEVDNFVRGAENQCRHAGIDIDKKPDDF